MLVESVFTLFLAEGPRIHCQPRGALHCRWLCQSFMQIQPGWVWMHIPTACHIAFLANSNSFGAIYYRFVPNKIHVTLGSFNSWYILSCFIHRSETRRQLLGYVCTLKSTSAGLVGNNHLNLAMWFACGFCTN